MADVYEQNLAQKTSLTTSDYIRVVGSDNVSYKQLVSDVASKIITTYASASLGGKSQSVKSFADHWGTAVAYTGNIDTLYESSIYTYNISTATGTFPATTQYGTIITIGGTSTNFATQIIRLNDNLQRLYIRYRSSGTWSDWTILPTRAEIDTLNSKIQSHTIANGASATFTLGSTTKALLTMVGGTASSRGQYIVSGYTSSIETTAILATTTATVSVSGLTLTITNNSGYALYPCFTVYQGSVTKQ